MKKVLRITLIAVLAIIALIVGFNAFYYFSQRSIYDKFGKWEARTGGRDSLPWINFKWTADSFGNKLVEHTAMFVPVRIENLPQNFICQFDNGSDLTMIYGNPLKSLASLALKNKLRTDVHFRDSVFYLTDFHLQIGGQPFYSPFVFVNRDFGECYTPGSLTNSDTVAIGTIGADILQNKVLLIDYRARRLCILDSVPVTYRTAFVDIALDNRGRPVLTMQCKGKNYKVEFDCGSSLFPLLFKQNVVGELSQSKPTDTFDVQEWGKIVPMLGRPMNDSFSLAGHHYGNIEIYTSEEQGKENIPVGCDGITGNVLFLGKVLIIDFKNKKLGLL